MVGDALSSRPHADLAPGAHQAAAQEGDGLRGRHERRLHLPAFLPAYDAMAASRNLLELLAPGGRPLSQLVAELPQPTLVHREEHCSWAVKGTVMRVLNERFASANIDLSDGIKVFDERGWMQVLPDPDEPLIHIYAEGATRRSSRPSSKRRCARSFPTSSRGRKSAPCRESDVSLG